MVKVISFFDLLQMDIPPIEYLVKPIIPKKGLVICAGPPDSGKTNFLMFVAQNGCEGKDVFEFEVKKEFKTLWIDEENREEGMYDKIKRIKNGLGTDDEALKKNLIMICEGFQLLKENWKVKLRQIINEHRPDLVVIDSIAKVFPLSERDEKDVRRIFTQLNPLIIEFGVTFVLIHHTRKGDSRRTILSLEDIAGSREFGAMPDSGIIVQKIDEDTFLLKHDKHRHRKKHPMINFKFEGDDEKLILIYDGQLQDKFRKMEEEIAGKIKEWCFQNPQDEYETKEIKKAMKELRYKETNIFNALKKLVEDKFFIKLELGKYTIAEGD